MNRQARKLLQEISELEKTWHKAVNKRTNLLEEIKNQETQEISLQEELYKKKQELRELLESFSNSFEGIGDSRKMYAFRRCFNLTFQNNSQQENLPKKIATITPEETQDAIVFRLRPPTPKHWPPLLDIRIQDAKSRKPLAYLTGPRYQTRKKLAKKTTKATT